MQLCRAVRLQERASATAKLTKLTILNVEDVEFFEDGAAERLPPGEPCRT
jgi:hypothetical protein